jgi:hypothetical protein
MAYSESVERWLACRWGMAFGFSDREVVEAMAENEERESYGCMKSEVIDSHKFPVYSIRHRRQMYEIAELHGFGKLASDDVIGALAQSCLGCPFFRNRFE